MLSTGVDLPALGFLVFLRPFKSWLRCKQMLGRGTCRCADTNESHFTVLDCFDGTLLEYFKEVSALRRAAGQAPRTIQKIIEAIWQNRDRPYNIRCLIFRLLEAFDIKPLAALTAPRPLSLAGVSPRARAELAGLKAWYKALGVEREPLR